MALTIEHRVINLITERLRDHLISGAASFALAGTTNPTAILARMVLGGSANVPYPRKFEIEITEAGKASITETTLWANLGNKSPEPYETVIDFSVGVPFAIDDTGVTMTIQTGYAIGDICLVRMGNADKTIVNIVPHPFDFTSLKLPSLSVYIGDTTSQTSITEGTESRAPLILVLCVSASEFNSGDVYEILGDIRDCINRDRNLWDNTTCLSTDLQYNSHELFDLTDNNAAIFMIDSTITYRSNTKNSRIK